MQTPENATPANGGNDDNLNKQPPPSVVQNRAESDPADQAIESDRIEQAAKASEPSFTLDAEKGITPEPERFDEESD
jgi:hypothetical protein